MNQSGTTGTRNSNDQSRFDKRHHNPGSFVLVELNLSSVLDREAASNDHYPVNAVLTSGAVREVCPVCETVHLKLVLRQTHVKQEHLFCEQCMRCFDADYADGSSALSID